jgi:hypothetical protein
MSIRLSRSPRAKCPQWCFVRITRNHGGQKDHKLIPKRFYVLLRKLAGSVAKTVLEDGVWIDWWKIPLQGTDSLSTVRRKCLETGIFDVYWDMQRRCMAPSGGGEGLPGKPPPQFDVVGLSDGRISKGPRESGKVYDMHASYLECEHRERTLPRSRRGKYLQSGATIVGLELTAIHRMNVRELLASLKCELEALDGENGSRSRVGEIAARLRLLGVLVPQFPWQGECTVVETIAGDFAKTTGFDPLPYDHGKAENKDYPTQPMRGEVVFMPEWEEGEGI